MSRPPAPRARRRHLPAGLAPLLALLGVFACSDSNSPTTEPGGTTAPTCSVTLSAPEAVPGSELVVSGLEAAAEARGAVFSAGGAQSIAPVRVDEAGALRVMVPLHPAGAAGGAAQMTLYVGERGCHPVDVRIQALVAAPGTTEAMLDNLDHAMAEMARISGVDPQALEGDPSQLPPHLTPILLARRLLSDPNNPNSVRAMLAGTAPALAGAAPESSTVYALSDWGDAVGVSGGEPVVWKDGRVHPLRALIPQESGWQIDRVVDLNDQGWMIGVGTRNGAIRAFVMRPQ